MPYYVLGPGGTKAGPVELPMLQQWAREGRVGPETLIEDQGGTKVPARAVNGLPFSSGSSAQIIPGGFGGPVANASNPVPVQSNYLRHLGGGGDSSNLFRANVHAAWLKQGVGALILGLLSGGLFVFIPFLTFGRLLFIALGLCLYAGWCGGRGVSLGDRTRGYLLISASAVSVCLVLIGIVVRIFR